MTDRRRALTPDALTMLDAIARTGSFAAAARELGKVPSALTYSVRQLEDALDVLLFDRGARQAQPTAAGAELLREGRRLLHEIDAVANRVQRVASGWEAQLAIAIDDAIAPTTVFELVQAFCAHTEGTERGPPPTRLRLRNEVLAGTWEALVAGQADLALGVPGGFANPGGIELRPLGEITFVYCVAPHHPLAREAEPLDDSQLVRHRAVAVADTARRMAPLSVNLLPGQDVLTVGTMRAKVEAQLRGLGAGYVPEPMARAHLEAGHLVRKRTARGEPMARMHYAWRSQGDPASPGALNPRGGQVGPARPGGHSAGQMIALGRALRWWLEQLESETTRRALLERHAGLSV